ncbi:hypothetical protein CYMTET_39255 [Cymbomonas tetramitiformis]|uniref:DSBA-like thioredoxin domain-containing protein n=1 Tax=Cymbomonas tetramitiformis TaxID=36881 RepID=A0AAE0CC47_9CHLO|nr:hypothetical protein CYMTET_39255 [Cymbomonas tetramitiformis]
MRNLESAMKAFPQAQFRVSWKPFFLDPSIPVEGEWLDDYILRVYGRKMDLSTSDHPLNQAGSKAGITFAYPRLVVNTMKSHRLVEYAGIQGADFQDKVIELLFSRYFENLEDISSSDVLIKIAEDAGLNGAQTLEFLKTEQYKSEVAQQYEAAKRMRISGVPHFIISKGTKGRKIQLSGGQPVAAFKEAFEELGER